MDDRTGSQEDLVFAGVPGSGNWSDWRSWTRRQKLMVAISLGFSVAVLTSLIIVVATYSATSTVIPTPTPPTTTTTPSTTTSPTTTTTTTTTPKTTTTPTTTTPTTTPTTTTTSTTTSKPTTTTTKQTTTPPTTKATTTTTQSPGPYHPSTKKPFPSDWESKPPLNLLMEEGLDPHSATVHCLETPKPVFRMGFFIPSVNHTWFADGDKKKEASTLAARRAVEELFNVKYTKPEPPPPTFNCTPTAIE